MQNKVAQRSRHLLVCPFGMLFAQHRCTEIPHLLNKREPKLKPACRSHLSQRRDLCGVERLTH